MYTYDALALPALYAAVFFGVLLNVQSPRNMFRFFRFFEYLNACVRTVRKNTVKLQYFWKE